jgi:hypothetical protein
MKEYLIHGTQLKNLIHILQDGYIDINPPKKYRSYLINNSPNQIFTQLIYKDIPNQKNQIAHWFAAAIILDKKILKDYPFYATGVGGFSDKFENGMKSDNVIIYGDGNLSKMPNLTKLKNKINKWMERIKDDDETRSTIFMHTNEILFNQKIPLDKYCIKIIMYSFIGNKDTKYNKIIEHIIKLAKEKNIPLTFRDPKLIDQNKPLNSFINSIETD